MVVPAITPTRQPSTAHDDVFSAPSPGLTKSLRLVHSVRERPASSTPSRTSPSPPLTRSPAFCMSPPALSSASQAHRAYRQRERERSATPHSKSAPSTLARPKIAPLLYGSLLPVTDASSGLPTTLSGNARRTDHAWGPPGSLVVLRSIEGDKFWLNRSVFTSIWYVTLCRPPQSPSCDFLHHHHWLNAQWLLRPRTRIRTTQDPPPMSLEHDRIVPRTVTYRPSPMACPSRYDQYSRPYPAI